MEQPKANTNTNHRKTWDVEAYQQKAKDKDAEERERMQANDKLVRQGKKPRLKPKEDLPKPTQLLQQREAPLELDKNLNKTMIVANTGNRGTGQPGFYCEMCKRNYRDTVGYLDHINSRAHLKRLGQTTTIERSTLAQVREKIAALRAETAMQATAKTFDFEQRLAEIRSQEEVKRTQAKEEKKAARDAARAAIPLIEQDDEMSATMGFAGFGSTKKA